MHWIYGFPLSARFPFKTPGKIFWRSVSPNSRKGWRKLWFALSKVNQKILGTLVYLYFVWSAVFLNVMALQFSKYYLPYCVVLSFSPLLCNHDKKLLKKRYLNEGWFFVGTFKAASLPWKYRKFISLAMYIKERRWVKAKILLISC